MSRLGKKPVPIPKGAKIALEESMVCVEGPLGKLERNLCPEVAVRVEGDKVVVERRGNSRHARAMHGTTRAHINNMLIGVTAGFSKRLLIAGMGFNAKLAGSKVTLSVGFANTHEFSPPPGVKIEVPQPTQVVISGADKEAVGALAAAMRAVRPAEPYNLQGIRYDDEIIKRKVGKSLAGGAK